MPVPRDHLAALDGAAAPVARVAAAETRREQARIRLVDDLFRSDEARLDDRTRARARVLLAETVTELERTLRLGAARRLAAWGEQEAGRRLAAAGPPVLERLLSSGVLAEPDMAAALVESAEFTRLAADLPAAGGRDRPSLLPRLAECPEPMIAEAALAMMPVANGHAVTPLPAGFAVRLAWWVAALLARRADGAPLSIALAEAVEEFSAVSAEPAGEQIAARLAVAVAARPGELPDLLLECLTDRQPALFVAFLAQALALPVDEVRSALLDREGVQLMLCLRAAGLGRETIARVGVLLAGADPLRDLEHFADKLDQVAALAPAEAMASLAPLTLPPAFRQACRELGL